MLLDRLLRRRPAQVIGRQLYAEVVEIARATGLYTTLAVPDTVEGRFEAYTLHVVLLLDRLKRQGPQAAETAQSLFDTYVTSLDHALREMGVGDLSVGKKMRRLGEAFFGRVKSYEEAFASLPDAAELEATLARTVYADIDGAPVAALSAYVLAQRAALAKQPLEEVLAARLAWSPA